MTYEVFKRKLIYVYGIPGDAHKGLLKIGETTIETDCDPNQAQLEFAANKRIKQSTNTAGVKFDLRHVELAVTDNGKAFGDREVHEVLKRSGVEKVSPEGTTAREWFRLDLKIAIRAIQAVKRGEKALKRLPKTFREEIIFRPEQERAISRTVKYFAKKRNKTFLWNAKMRFGKTLCALEVVRQMNFGKTLIVTHRPAVKENWFDDYQNIFDDNNYGSKSRGESLKTLIARGKNFVYFASIQDLRGSERFDKNHDILGEDWDFVIVDEAHEGTQTTIGKKLLAELVKPATKVLQLSGTPFNLIDDFTEENSFTWDYVDEQRAKADWYLNHGDIPNPYVTLPKMHIYTYDLGELIGKSYLDIVDKAFNFREFFRTNDKGKFVHEADVKRFLDLLVKADKNNYPFSRPEFCDMFRHTLWIVPGVKAGQALSKLLDKHVVFGNENFGIANVAGDGDEDIPYTDALELVQKTIAENDYSITISCGKLTTGVTVPEWTAVLYMAGSYSTSPTSYLQTIFRVQNPCNLNGVIKTDCYVFDFAPDRTLKMVTEAADVSARAGQTSAEHRKRLDEFLNFCPVIALTGSRMNSFDADKLLQDIKSVYAERAVRNGFDHRNLYNDKLLKLTDLDWQKFKMLDTIVGKSGKIAKPSEVTVNKQGLDDEQHEGTDTVKKPKRELSPEELELQRQRKVKSNAISILRQVSIRMPLLIYGAEVDFDTDITIDQFAGLVDDASWAEFMPKGVTKEFFAEFVDYYEPDVFVKAGRLVRQRAKAADSLPPTERVKEIAEMFATFKNPDKETVLTPWRVVNLHMTEVFGGWNFFADDPPQLVPTEIFRANSHILEINSKTGLYPLFVAYSIYRARLGNDTDKSLGELRRIWDMTVAENVFVICKTPMAKTITRRTLTGYRGSPVNAECFKDLIPTLKMTPQRFIDRVTDKNFWFKGAHGKMKFDAVVGNPPYQNAAAGDSNRMLPVYNHFIDTAFKLADKVSLIHPARCLFTAGDTSNEFNRQLLTNSHVKVIRYEADSKALFPTSEIKGGVAITYYDKNQNFGAIGLYIPWDELRSVYQKVCVDNKDFRPLSEIVYPRAIYRFVSDNSFVDTNAFDKMSTSFFDAVPNDGHEYVQVLGLKKLQRFYKWIRRDWITDHVTLDKWKVFVPQANGSGEFGETLSAPLVGKPLVGNTATFTVIGAFDTEAEAVACLKYIKSKFCRALLGVLKVTQHNPPSTWAKVPLQDFTSSSEIDWTQAVAQIDEQLYRKYNLTQAEIDFIESHVKEMQ